MKKFRVSTDLNEMDFNMIYSFISTSYWAKGIPQSVMKKAIQNSFCFGIFGSNDRQVGFARLITDKATFAYLADVFILPDYRGQGLSKYLVAEILDHPELKGLRRMMLATKDAHGLYQQFGFQPINAPEMLMQIHQPDVYSKQD